MTYTVYVQLRGAAVGAVDKRIKASSAQLAADRAIRQIEKSEWLRHNNGGATITGATVFNAQGQIVLRTAR